MTSARRKRVLVAAAGALAVGGILFGILSRRGPAGPEDARLLRWPYGEERVYELTYKSAVSGVAGAAVIDLRLSGKLKIAAVDEAATVLRVKWEGQLANAHSADVALSKEWLQIENGLLRPFTIQLAPDGQYTGLRFVAGTQGMVQQVWHQVASALQLAGRRGADTWEAEEDDNVGTYVARYARGREPGQFTRDKLSYRTLHTQAQVRYELGGARSEFHLEPTGELRTLQADEQISARANPPMPQFESSTEIALVFTGAGGRIADPGAALAQAMSESVSVPGPHPNEGLNRELDDARIGGRSLSAVLGALSEMARLGDGHELTSLEKEREGRALIALAALLRQQPKQLGPIREHLKERGPLTSKLLEALRGAGTPEAQALLREALGYSRLDHPSRVELARALSRVDEPTPETVKTLRQLQNDPLLRPQATFGLGSNAYRLRDADPQAAGAIVSDLVRQLREAPSTGERAMLLTALGNAGSTEAIEAVTPYLADESELVRVNAARALRRVSGDAADGLLVAAMADPSASVRVSAIDAISEHGATSVLVAAVDRAALGDKAVGVRMRAVRTAADWVGAHPELLATLETVSHSDSKAEIRRAAQHGLDARTQTQ